MLDPFRAEQQLRQLVEGCPLPVEMHAHNDFGLATANSLASAQRRLQIRRASSDIVELMRLMRIDRHMDIL